MRSTSTPPRRCGAPSTTSSETVRLRHPEVRINGVSIEPYLYRPAIARIQHPGASRRDLRSGDQPRRAGRLRPRTFALPPLNAVLARDLIDSAIPTAALGPAQPGRRALNRVAIEQVLVSVSDLV